MEEKKEATKEEVAEETDKSEEKEEKEQVSVKDAKDKQEESEKETEASSEKEAVEVPDKFKKLVEQIEQMTVLELNELVKVLEKKFGVSAQAVAVADPAGASEAGAEEQDSFTVELADVGGQKIQVIKVVKEVLGLGLKEAKDLVDSAPSVLKEGVKKEEAEEIKDKVAAAGGSVNLK